MTLSQESNYRPGFSLSAEALVSPLGGLSTHQRIKRLPDVFRQDSQRLKASEPRGNLMKTEHTDPVLSLLLRADWGLRTGTFHGWMGDVGMVGLRTSLLGYLWTFLS